MKTPARLIAIVTILGMVLIAGGHAFAGQPITIGESFTLDSRVLEETRRINVFKPTVYGKPVEEPLAVLYMLDGGIEEDFLHIAGLVQILVSNQSLRPLLLVGIENTERGRDMTGPSDDAQDLEDIPLLGGSNAFRRFIREELFSTIGNRYNVTSERAIIGESLAGLFVVETLLQQPEMFQTYIAIDPSVWWNRYALNDNVSAILDKHPLAQRRLWIGAGQEASQADRFKVFIDRLSNAQTKLALAYRPMPSERHATLYHPAALAALRQLFPAASAADD